MKWLLELVDAFLKYFVFKKWVVFQKSREISIGEAP